MPVNSVHPQYLARQGDFLDCRTAFEGSKAIKQAGERYLPRLKNQTQDDYDAYKTRAVFFSITGKTVAAMTGMAMMRQPVVTHTPRFDPYFKERQGHQFLEICGTAIQEVLLMGGYGLLIDAANTGNGSTPEIVRYYRENIINWKTDPVSGATTMVMLQESVERLKSDDEYELEMVTRYRKLFLDADGNYTVEVYDDGMKFVERSVPTVRGMPMKIIPFILINPLGVSMDVVKPPMLDIVDLNISHYRTSADLEHGRHFTGLPTPVIIGLEASTPMYIGSSSAWIIPNADADVKYLEFLGQGLTSLEHAMVEKQGQMASMSARLIDNSKRGSEAAETVRLRYMSESASLTVVVSSVEEGLNMAYGIIADILEEEHPAIKLNKEFMDTRMSPQEIKALVEAYLAGTISKETLLFNMRKGDLISPYRTDAEELAEIKDPPKEPVAPSAAGRPASATTH